MPLCSAPACLQANLHEHLSALKGAGKSGLGTGQAARLGTGKALLLGASFKA